MVVDLFQNPLSTSEPPAHFKRKPHSQPPVNSAANGPLQTNNTFNNLLLDDQTFPIWPLPYSMWVCKDGDADWGMALNHTDSSQYVFGPDPNQDPAQFFFNPPKIKSFAFTAPGFGNNLKVTTVKSGKLSALVQLENGQGRISMPLAYGMGFVTGIYENLVPVLTSQVGFMEFKKVGIVNQNRTAKYSVKLFDQKTWSIYLSGDPNIDLRLADNNHIVASGSSKLCVVQVCKGDSPAYDDACGMYPISVKLSGSVDAERKSGKYSFKYDTHGSSNSGSSLVWCLPHHQVMLSPDIKKRDSGMQLDSPTNGPMRGYVTNELEMTVQNLPTDIGFEPWTSVDGFSFDANNFTPEIKQLIGQVASQEIEQDVAGQCDLDSMYFGGKQLDKYAYLALVTHFVLQDQELTNKILPKIKAAIEKYASNCQQHPLCYDESWKGVISDTPPDQDSGNSNYNDHHFHYGYHIHAIAIVARIDPGWLSANNNLVHDYAMTLVRDYGNPSDNDPFFPQFRNFDWFHGHSFAHGIFPSGDGKNEESSSEDYHSVYALKLFGNVIGNQELEMAAALMLGIMKTSLNMYMMYTSDNELLPKRFTANKVSGILFENKIDFATFFGRGTVGDEYVHGIHMIPITPMSSYIRGSRYVKEEWDAKLAGIVDKIPDGWQGILKLNAGLFDPRYSWKWFSRNDWQDNLIDPGMTRSWALAYLAGIGGAK
ncbi:endo-1,3-beta glucanase [Candidozyma auris]|uniref:glucan endo-1,3-beta-D-glucosidase n=1 Tax=Candidozyma auris TaxID=498019 RepID=A0A8F3AI83_CANAR|nr:hypothetical protein CA7LBN_003917 [[Candida] auris]